MSKTIIASLGIGLAIASAPVSAQLLPGGRGGVLGPVGSTVGSVERTVGGVLSPRGSTPNRTTTLPSTVSLDSVTTPLGSVMATPMTMLDARRARLDGLVAAHRGTLDRDPTGAPVQRAHLVVTDPPRAALDRAIAAGFRVVRAERLGELGIDMVTLAPPKGDNVREAAKRLAKIAPELAVSFDHIYEPAGGSLGAIAGAALAGSASVRAGTRIAMIDGGMATHPSFAGTPIEQRGFAGPAQATGHGTAVGSLLVGQQGAFRGAARGASLFVGDVYGGNASAGSASVIVRALAWAASKRPQVINISLVGPANAVLERAIAAVRAKGIAVVAAVGNDGPAAPPQYPASYEGVVAVTGVDAKDRALREAGRSTHLDFAAPGADLAAALPGQGYVGVRGTSFASPLVAARLAATGSLGALSGEAVPGKGKVGRGIVCRTCRIAPQSVGAK